MKRIKIGILIGIFVLFLPITLPVGLVVLGVIHLREQDVLRTAALKTSCEKCGKLLGRESLKLADAEVARQYKERAEKYPGVRFRILRTLHAICPQCGARFTFLKKSRAFVLENIEATLKQRKKLAS